MKRIEFIAPIESMRGNLSETQKNIVYPTHDNRAYDGPVGERNTARNYQPIVIGAKRKDGKTYFSIKTKTTNHLTTIAKHAMAAMGGACSIFAAAMKNSAILAKMSAILKSYAAHGYVYTYRQLFMPWVRDAVASKSAVIDLSSSGISLTINNPFVSGGSAEYNVTIPDDVITKFSSELSN